MPGSDRGPGGDLYVRAIDDLVDGRHRNGLHRLAVDRPAADVAGTVGAAGWRTFAVTVDASTTKGGVLAALAAAAGFPEWVGPNWDGLQDALRDLSWAPADGFVALIDGWDDFAVAQPLDAAVLGSVLAESARWWAEAGTPFHVLLR
ncbi:MAG: barstar family protein [Actinomycetota bacterium]